MNAIKVPARITQEQADCVGCTPEQYERIVTVASLFVPLDTPVIITTDGLRWPYVSPEYSQVNSLEK